MIYALIVVYNKVLKDSESYCALTSYIEKKGCKNIQLNIYDNSEISTICKNNKAQCIKEGFNYFGIGKNIGLSKAYNFVIKSIHKAKRDYVLILDDDTCVTYEFLDEAIEKCAEGISDIYIPVVKTSNGNIFSPSILKKGFRSKPIHQVNELKNKELTAINSGMLVRSTVYDRVKYNEKLFVDCIDHDFIIQVNDNCYVIEIMKNFIMQHVAIDEEIDAEKVLKRFRIFLKDYRNYCCQHGHEMIYTINSIRFSIMYCLRFRTIEFFKILKSLE